MGSGATKPLADTWAALTTSATDMASGDETRRGEIVDQLDAFRNQLKPPIVIARIELNAGAAAMHRTAAFDDACHAEYALVRRGAPIPLRLFTAPSAEQTLPTADALRISAELTGDPNGREFFDALRVVSVGPSSPDGGGGSVLELELTLAADTPLGAWRVVIVVAPADRAAARVALPQPLVVLGNPWCAEDGLFLEVRTFSSLVLSRLVTSRRLVLSRLVSSRLVSSRHISLQLLLSSLPLLSHSVAYCPLMPLACCRRLLTLRASRRTTRSGASTF